MPLTITAILNASPGKKPIKLCDCPLKTGFVGK